MSISFKIMKDWLSKGLKRSSLLTNTYHFEERTNCFYYDLKIPAIKEIEFETLSSHKFTPYPVAQAYHYQNSGLQGLGIEPFCVIYDLILFVVSNEEDSKSSWSTVSDNEFLEEHFIV